MVAVTFVNPATGQRLQVNELDELMTVGEAVENLVDQNFIPRADNGQHYELQVKGKGVLTQYDATMQAGGVANGDVISVGRAQRGGC
jgi:hypothetical protein